MDGVPHHASAQPSCYSASSTRPAIPPRSGDGIRGVVKKSYTLRVRRFVGWLNGEVEDEMGTGRMLDGWIF